MSTIWTLHGFSEIGGALKFQQSLFQASFGDLAILCISGQSRARRNIPFIRQLGDVAEEPEVPIKTTQIGTEVEVSRTKMSGGRKSTVSSPTPEPPQITARRSSLTVLLLIVTICAKNMANLRPHRWLWHQGPRRGIAQRVYKRRSRVPSLTDYAARLSTRDTCIGFQRFPRRVVCPWSFKSSAIACSDRPFARSSLTTGNRSLYDSSAARLCASPAA